MRVSVDIGFGYVKAVDENGKQVVFPSVVSPDESVKSGMSQLFGMKKDDYQLSLRSMARPDIVKKYLVGDAAMVSGSAVRTWEDQATQNGNLKPLVFTALAALVDGETCVELALGLPMSFYHAQKNSVQEMFTGLSYQVNVGDRICSIQLNSVFVFPQGAGAYYDACLHTDGSLKNPSIINAPVGVIDVGYRTTDFLVMARGKNGLVPRDDLSGSIDAGMNMAHQDIQKKVEKLVGKNIDLLKIEQALMWNNCSFVFQGQNYDLYKFQEDAFESLGQRIAAQIKIKWGAELDHLAAVLLAGGGGEALYSVMKNSFTGAQAIEAGVFSNARGFLAVQALKQKNKMS